MLEKLPAGHAVGTVPHPAAPRQVPGPLQSSAGGCAARLRAVFATPGVGNVPRKILLKRGEVLFSPSSLLREKSRKRTVSLERS